MEYKQAENYMCMATLLEMVIEDVGVHGYDRFSIANEMGVTLPPNTSEPVIKATHSQNEYEWGIKVDTEVLNLFFESRRIPLKACYVHATQYTLLEKESLTWANCYVIFLFSYGELYGDPRFKDLGHVALFLRMLENHQVRIYDPGPLECGEKTVSCYRMEEAMYLRQGGYLLLQRLDMD